MEVILISNSKVKIMLTEEDLREFAIDCDAAESDADLRRRFKDVLRRADDDGQHAHAGKALTVDEAVPFFENFSRIYL